MGEEGVILEDGVDITLIRRQVGHVLAVQQNLARGGLVEPGDHAQTGGLAAAGGTEHGEELTILNIKCHIVHGINVSTKAPRDILEVHSNSHAGDISITGCGCHFFGNLGEKAHTLTNLRLDVFWRGIGE